MIDKAQLEALGVQLAKKPFNFMSFHEREEVLKAALLDVIRTHVIADDLPAEIQAAQAEQIARRYIDNQTK